MDKSTKFLVCVSTPLQYINALELLSYLKISESNCFLIITSHNKNTIVQINRIFNTNNWDGLSKPFIINSKLWLFSFIYLRFLFSRYKNRAKVVGNLSDIKNRVLINNSFNSQVFVVDDGANSIFINKLINEKISYNSNSLNSKLEKLFFGNGEFLRNRNINFSTAYKNLSLDNNVKYIKNNFSRLISKTKLSTHTKKEVDEIWLLGAHFVKLGIIKADIYRGILTSIRDWAEDNGLKFVYFGHRSELNHDQNIFNGIEVITNEEPFELYLLHSSIKPKIIASFYSSALFNLTYLVPKYKLISYNLMKDGLLAGKANQNNLRLIYDYIKLSTGIELKDIPSN